MKKIILFILFINYSQAQVPTTWTSKGIGGGGALFAPSIHPNNAQEIYISCDMGEIFHTTTMGATWDALHFLNVQGNSHSKVIFTNSNTRYTVNKSLVDANEYVSLTKSIDGGNTWQTLNNSVDNNQEIYFLDADYSNANNLIYATYNNIWFSNNGGATYTLAHSASNTNIGAGLSGCFFDGTTIYFACNDGIFISTNSGSSWNAIPINGLQPNEYIASFAGAKQNNQTIFSFITTNASYAYTDYMPWNGYSGFVSNIYKLNPVNNNAQIISNGLNIISQDFLKIAMANNDTTTIYLAGVASSIPNIYKSSNSGNTWNSIFLSTQNQNINTGWCGDGGDRAWWYAEIPFGFDVQDNNKDVVMFTDYGFAHLSQNGGTSWQQLYVAPTSQNNANANITPGKKYINNGLENTSAWKLFWCDANTIIAGYSDIRGTISTDGGATWSIIPFLGNNVNTIYDAIKINNVIYIATSQLHDLYETTQLYDDKIDANPIGAIYYSTDNGSTFNLLKTFNRSVVHLAKHPTDNNTMYCTVAANNATTGGIYMTNDLNNNASSSWVHITSHTRAGGHADKIKVLNNGDIIYTVCARSQYRNNCNFDASSGVYYFENATQTWFDRSNSEMMYFTKDIEVDNSDVSQSTWYVSVWAAWANAPDTALAGIYKTTNKGISWQKIKYYYRPSSVAINPVNNNEMYVCTESRGLQYCNNLQNNNPTFTTVNNYGFRHPQNIYFNPYNLSEVWITSFGNGIKQGNISSGILTSNQKNEYMNIYPNPSNMFVNIEVDEALKNGLLYILDSKGAVVQNITITKNKFRIDISKWPTGIYFISDLSKNIGKIIKVE